MDFTLNRHGQILLAFQASGYAFLTFSDFASFRRIEIDVLTPNLLADLGLLKYVLGFRGFRRMLNA